MKLSDFTGNHVRISFKRPIEANGYEVKRIEGELCDLQGTAFALNGITAAFAGDGNDVTRVANLLNGAIVGDLRNVSAIVRATAVQRDGGG